jgi:hypothetical protein
MTTNPFSSNAPSPRAASGSATYAEASEEQRAELLQRLEQHRQRIDDVLSPQKPAPARLAAVGGDGFPRSYTMRLILSEPLILTAVTGVVAKLFGARLLRALPVAVAVAKSVQAALHPPASSHPAE